ncbi:MAG: FAD-dependent oxidoreductase [Pseudomonadota bacterium]
MDTDTLIIGGGLCGLGLAQGLAARGQDFLLVEARDRLGGRILTQDVESAAFDLGPAWFWPGQPRLAALVDGLNLTRFDQFAQGDLLVEDGEGRVQRGGGFAAMAGSWRLDGGFGALVTALAKTVPKRTIRSSMQVVAVSRTDVGITATTQTGQTIQAARAVLALPPRMAAGITFSPALPARTTDALLAIPTWMAGQAKAVAVYDTPFWRSAGLSGDAMSRRGPMVEIHDASVMTGEFGALFGFIGVPPQARVDLHALKHATQTQLIRLFGPQAAQPVALVIKDWASDAQTATAHDHAPLHHHPRYGLPADLQDPWHGALLFSGSETAPQFGGYLEGALEAAQTALARLTPETA